MPDKRVVITGLGVITSLGIGKDKFWRALLEGRSGISKISSFDSAKYAVHFGGEVKNFPAEEFLSKRRISACGRASCFSVCAAKLALKDAGLEAAELGAKRAAVCIGTTSGESQIVQKLNYSWVHQGLEAVEPRLIPRCPTNMLAVNVGVALKLHGPNFVIPNACAAGNFAIGYGYDLLKLGDADIALAGGSDGFSKIAFTGFARMFAIAPEKCQPFDKNRKGMLVAEGAGVVVLELLENALKRKAPIYAEILGYGVSCDARHMTAPFAGGISEAIENALAESKVSPSEVDYISAHGTGTLVNDREECAAIKKAFPGNYKKIPISSIKSMLGHTMGAASGIETAACCLSIINDYIPPTINYETPDPECDIDCVPNAGRKLKVNIALNNASAFGGNNSCLVLKKYGE